MPVPCNGQPHTIILCNKVDEIIVDDEYIPSMILLDTILVDKRYLASEVKVPFDDS